MDKVEFESEYFSFRFEGGIFYLTYIRGPITLDVAKDVVERRLAVTGDKLVPIIVNDVGLKGIERDARDYLANGRGVEGLSAGALVTDSAFGSHLANFYLKISLKKSPFPVKVFSKEKDAIEWAKAFMD